MKQKQTTACVGSMSAVMWGKAVGYGISLGTLLGTVVGVAMKNSMLVYIGMVLGWAIGAMFKSKQPRSDCRLFSRASPLNLDRRSRNQNVRRTSSPSR